jgi:perosamine synthetase
MYLALRAEGIGRGAEVLVPAFHCPSMVSPIVAAGAQPVFYGITEDLACDSRSLLAKLTRATRAVIVPHLFGRVQSLAEIRSVCTERRLTLIEDCAHTITGAPGGSSIGLSGDYVIASPRKFVALSEGGWIAGAALERVRPYVVAPPFSRNLRMLYDMADRSDSSAAALLRWVISARKHIRKRTAEVSDVGVAIAADAPLEREIAESRAASAVTRILLSLWDFAGAARARRNNYDRVAKALSQVSSVSVHNSSLPLSSAPYMVPVILNRPAQQFALIKQSSVPIWRWEHSQRGVCKVTDKYAEALIQVPCHQSLSELHLQSITETLCRA